MSTEPDVIRINLRYMPVEFRLKVIKNALETAGYNPKRIASYLIYIRENIDKVTSLSFERIKE